MCILSVTWLTWLIPQELVEGGPCIKQVPVVDTFLQMSVFFSGMNILVLIITGNFTNWNIVMMIFICNVRVVLCTESLC